MGDALDQIFIYLGLKSDGVKKGAAEAEQAVKKGADNAGKAVKQSASDAEKAVKQSADGMKQAGASIGSAFSAITAKLGALGVAAAAAFSISSRFSEYAAEADAMGKLADALDVDVSKMHAWGEAAARAGGSAAAFQGSLQSLTGQLARQATTGTSRAAKMLEGVGIDAGEIGRQRQAFDVMMDLAAKAETMGKQEFFGLGRSLGLDQGTIMLLQQGREALKDQIRLQKEFGVYSKEDAKITADWNDRVADFGQVMKSFASIVFRMVLPALTKFISILNNCIAFLRKHEHFVQAFFIGLAAVITGILLPALAKMAAAWLANPMTLTIMAIVAALAALALVIEDLVVWAEGGESALGDLWEAIFGSPKKAQETWQEIKDGFTELWEAVKPILEWIKEALIETFKAVYPYVVKFVASSIELINGLKQKFTVLADHIKSMLGSAMNWVIEKWNAVAAVLGMTKINVRANVEVAPIDATHGGGGDSLSGFLGTDTTPQRPEEAQADGGILTTPTHALVAEDGPEAIIPLGQKRRARAMEIFSKVSAILGTSATAADALPAGGSVVNNASTRNVETNIGEVNVYTQATDARGIASDIGGSMRDSMARFNTAQADYAY